MNGQPFARKLETILGHLADQNNMELLVEHNPSKLMGSAGYGNPSTDFAFQYENSFEMLCSFTLGHADHMGKFLVDRHIGFNTKEGHYNRHSDIKYTDGKAMNDFVEEVRDFLYHLEE